MRKLTWLMHLSLDGFVAGPKGEIDWIQLDPEMFDDVHRLVSGADTALYGRTTYGMMEAYWPTAADQPNATKHDIEHGTWANAATKFVFSRTLDKVTWKNTRIVKDHAVEEVTRLKKQPGKNIILFASPTLASTLVDGDLIDDYWFTISPVILGQGKPLVKDIRKTHNLKLVESKAYGSGAIQVRYMPTGKT